MRIQMIPEPASKVALFKDSYYTASEGKLYVFLSGPSVLTTPLGQLADTVDNTQRRGWVRVEVSELGADGDAILATLTQ